MIPNPYRIESKIQRPRHSLIVDQSEPSTSKGSDEGRRHRDPVTHWRDKHICKRSQNTSSRKTNNSISFEHQSINQSVAAIGHKNAPRKAVQNSFYRYPSRPKKRGQPSMTCGLSRSRGTESFLSYASRICSKNFEDECLKYNSMPLNALEHYPYEHHDMSSIRSSPPDSSPTTSAYQSPSKRSDESVFRLRQLPPPRNDHCHHRYG